MPGANLLHPRQAARHGVRVLLEVLMRLKIKCWTGKHPAATPGAGRDTGDSTSPANPPASPVPIAELASREQEARKKKTTQTTSFLYKIHKKFKSVTIIYKTRKI